MLGGIFLFSTGLFLLTQRKKRSLCVLRGFTAWADVQRNNQKVVYICVYSVLCGFMFPSAIEELYFPELGLPPLMPRGSGGSWGVPCAGARALHSCTQPFLPTMPRVAALPGPTAIGAPCPQSAQVGGLDSEHSDFFSQHELG